MEVILFVGLPGAGKTSLFKERFFRTRVRISLDLLRTRQREWQFFQTCLATEQRCVIDNTNPTRADRSRYVVPAKAARFMTVGYYFQSKIEDCMRRNAARPAPERVPDVAIYSAAHRLELPTFDEGFDRLYYVRLEEGRFIIEEWRDEI